MLAIAGGLIDKILHLHGPLAYAGIAGIPYLTFLVYDVAGGALWAGGFTVLGYYGGREYRSLQHIVGRASLVVLGVVLFIVVVALAARWVASHREQVASLYERVR